MSVSVGDMIVEINIGKKLIVEGLWSKASKIIDFSAKYTERVGVDKYGNPVFANRRFRFEDEGVVWER